MELPPDYEGVIAAGGLRLAYRRWPGPSAALPIVLLHGLTGSSADWRLIGPHLARHGAVFAWDARGHAASGWASDAAYDGDAHFADVVQALDALGIDRCILAGFSMGGCVAILAAGALAERVARLVVIDAYPDPVMTPGSRQIAELIASYHFPDGRPSFDPAIAAAMAEQLSRDHPRRLDLWPFWEAASQPTLIVRGALSAVLTEPMAAEMLRRRPSARLITIPNVAHAIPARRPTDLLTAIDDFLVELS